MSNNNYASNNIKQLYLSLLPTQIFASITSSLSSIVNGLIIGASLSSLDMIALGFVSPIIRIVTVFSTIVASGSRITCGKYIGRGENKKINQTFTTAVYFLLFVGATLTLIGLLLSTPIAKIISSPDAVIKTSEYIRGLAIGMIPTSLIPCLMIFLQMRNENTYSLISTVVLAGSNLALCLIAMNYINLDINKIGIITSISQFITLGFILLRYWKVKTLPRLEISKERLLKNILILGLPSALADLLYGFRNTTLLKFADMNYGNAATNALSILGSSAGPFDAINIGAGATTLMLASVFIGEKDKESLFSLAKIAIKFAFILGFGKVILIYLTAEPLVKLFGATPGAVTNMSISLYRAYSLSMPLNLIALIIFNTYQASGKIAYCNFLQLLTAAIFPLVFAYFGKNLLGINSIWYCYAMAEVFTLLFEYIVACIRKKQIITSFNDLLVLDKQLDVGKHINITINTMEEVIDVSKKVQEHCIAEGIDSKKAYMAGLCCEEVAANIIEHGFSKSKRRNKSIDMFIDTDRGDVRIRIKDNAVPFDPHIKLQNNDDPTKNIGIKMVSKLAKDMEYQNTFGLNVLMITL